MKALKTRAGVVLLDPPRYSQALYLPWRGDADWVGLCNRIDRLVGNPEGPGVLCDSRWGSDLHATAVCPFLGARLMKVALDQWPIHFSERPMQSTGPKVSFLFAHAGLDRLPQLRRTILSLFAQTGVQIECVVVDQSAESIKHLLPDGVIFHHLQKRNCEAGWHKAWAYNVAARLATGDILVFHDGDVCAPERYAEEIVQKFREGYQAVSLQRFLFYLDESSTAALEQAGAVPERARVLRTYQNWKGGTIAVQRQAFFDIGGFDEGFMDWGGEDDEFYDRCGLLRHWRYGYLPFVHLWHVPQSHRLDPANPNVTSVLPERLEIAARSRARELAARHFGSQAGPDPRVSYKSSSAGARAEFTSR